MSSKLKGQLAPPEEDASIDMSPMIDMVFLLLIFFVVNATAITVKRDKNISMPVASNSGELKSANGCIVVNVYGEQRPKGFPADVMWGDDTPKPLATEDDIREYIHNKAEQFKKEDYHLRIYLRGDKVSLFKNSRTIIKVAGMEGISDIVFGVVPTKGS